MLFWLRAEDHALFTRIAEKLLRKKLSKGMDRASRDEVVFWFTLLGQPSNLQGVLRTLFKTDPTLTKFLEKSKVVTDHDRVAMKKNAFRLLQLRRYLLAIAAFLMGGGLPEALNVCAR